MRVHDEAKLQGLATYTEPHRFSVGIVHLAVNGVPVLQAGAITGAKPGRVLTQASSAGSLRRHERALTCAPAALRMSGVRPSLFNRELRSRA